MPNLVRQLVTLDMLKQELDDLKSECICKGMLVDRHLEIIRQCASMTGSILRVSEDLSEHDFISSIQHLDFEYQYSSKKLLNIHNKLLHWLIDFYSAKKESTDILDLDFTPRAEVRLNLWQSKAAKAKNHIKTLAEALGEDEYGHFIKQFRFEKSEFAWQQLLHP